MTIGTLLDLGLDLDRLEAELAKLPLSGYRLQKESVDKRGVQAVQFQVILTGGHKERVADAEIVEVHHPHEHEHNDHHSHEHEHDDHHHHHHDDESRTLTDILALIEASRLSERVKETARRIFTRLGRAEARVHGLSLEEVHFHEVGGVDAIVDIVGTAIGLEQLEIERVYASPLPLGSGFVRCAHGLYPVPAPATANLVKDAPVYTTAVQGELVTPTGAAIVTTLAHQFGPMPVMIPEVVGYGSGSRDREFPNVLRGYLGRLAADERPRLDRDPFPQQHEAPSGPDGYHEGPATIIEATIDDMNPQLFEHLTERLLQANALDVVLIPVQMKKNRPGTILHVLAHPDSVETLLSIIFTESTSIGARTYHVTKHMLQRESRLVETPFGPVRVKLARLRERIVNVAPEYEDCRALARQHNLPVKTIYQAALSQWKEAGSTDRLS